MKEFKDCSNGFEQLIQYANGETKGEIVTADLSIYVDNLDSGRHGVLRYTTFNFTPNFSAVDGQSNIGTAEVSSYSNTLSSDNIKAGTTCNNTWPFEAITWNANVYINKDVVIETADGIKGKMVERRYFIPEREATSGTTFTITVELELVK